jgi:hypothetical protein
MPTVAPVAKATVVLTKDKETKGTIRFATKEEAPVTQVYVERPWVESHGNFTTITLTIEA